MPTPLDLIVQATSPLELHKAAWLYYASPFAHMVPNLFILAPRGDGVLEKWIEKYHILGRWDKVFRANGDPSPSVAWLLESKGLDTDVGLIDALGRQGLFTTPSDIYPKMLLPHAAHEPIQARVRVLLDETKDLPTLVNNHFHIILGVRAVTQGMELRLLKASQIPHFPKG